MHILHIIASVDPRGGGPIEGVLRQAEILSRTRALGSCIRTSILSLDSPDASWVASCPVELFALGAQGWEDGAASVWQTALWMYRYAPRLVGWLRDNVSNYDAVVIHGLWNFSVLAASRVLTGGGVPYFVFPHGMLDPWFKRTYPLKHAVKQVLWLAGEGRVVAGADAVLFTSEDERLAARRVFAGYGNYCEQVVGFGAADVPVSSPGQKIAFCAAVPRLGDRRFLLFLSRLHPKKGCDLLLEAFAKVAPECPDIDLVMAGPDQTGWRGALEAQAERLGVGPRVHWPGMLTGDAKWGAIRGADAFVLPSHQENFGIAVAEAMACATAVLITDKVNIWREVHASGSGLVGADTMEGTRDLLARWIGLDDASKARMRGRARAGFLAHFDMATAAREFVRAVESACVARQGGHVISQSELMLDGSR